MESYAVFVPLSFFERLLPFQALLLPGNAFKVWAMGAQKRDGSIVRSQNFILFANGLATLVAQKAVLARRGITGYVMTFTKKVDARGVDFWLVQPKSNQESSSRWSLAVLSYPPDSDDEGLCQILLSVEGDPGQYIFIRGQSRL